MALVITFTSLCQDLITIIQKRAFNCDIMKRLYSQELFIKFYCNVPDGKRRVNLDILLTFLQIQSNLNFLKIA